MISKGQNQMNTYDLIVIGAGPGGYIAAIRGSELGLKTAIIEKDSLGGVCLNVGCIPSKSLLKNAELVRTLRKESETFGIRASDLSFDYAAAVDRSRKVSKRLNQGVAFLMKKNKIDVYNGKASFTDPKHVRVSLNSGEDEFLEAADFIIATGTVPTELKGMEFDGERILNYRQAILQTALPNSVVIIGGGAIGVEFATIWSAYGSAVTVVEMQPNLLPNEDPEAGRELERSFKKQGIDVKTGTRLKSIDKVPDGVMIHLINEKGESEVSAQQVLIAVGFRPNPAELNLEAAGVKTTERGWIDCDPFGKTAANHIYAVGDITGKILLAHSAMTMGRIAVEQIGGLITEPLNLDLVPHCTFSFPQVASFGLTEASADARKIKIKAGKSAFLANGKALGMNENEGWIKLICDATDHRILGATMIGAEVCELLPELTLAATKQLTAEDILMNIHAHPTLSEGIAEAAGNLLI